METLTEKSHADAVNVATESLATPDLRHTAKALACGVLSSRPDKHLC